MVFGSTLATLHFKHRIFMASHSYWAKGNSTMSILTTFYVVVFHFFADCLFCFSFLKTAGLPRQNSKVYLWPSSERVNLHKFHGVVSELNYCHGWHRTTTYNYTKKMRHALLSAKCHKKYLVINLVCTLCIAPSYNEYHQSIISNFSLIPLVHQVLSCLH